MILLVCQDRYPASQRNGLMCRNADTLKLLNETEKKLKQQQTEAYIDLDKAAEEREAGNKVRHAHVQPCMQVQAAYINQAVYFVARHATRKHHSCS